MTFFPVAVDGRRLIASAGGRGMMVLETSLIAEKRTGRQVFNLKDGDEIFDCIPVDGTHVLTLGHNKRALIFPMEQVPEMTRGGGVAFQKLGDSTLREMRTLTLSEGIVWQEGQRVRSGLDLAVLEGRRGAVGRAAPQWMLRKA